MNGLKKKTQIFVAWKKHNSATEIHIYSKWKSREKNIPCKWKEKWGVATIISDKINLNTKKLKRQRRALHNDSGINSVNHETTVNVIAPSARSSGYSEQMLKKKNLKADNIPIVIQENSKSLSHEWRGQVDRKSANKQ